ncbi:hypothetical protein ACSNOK_07910 [Streptomyces sp. URMC 126]|uniref:hypothetical protein n=1 Tax=Streptomyces sp. URMC 126 TaxID=3423401 RepID=UPI003F1CED7C
MFRMFGISRKAIASTAAAVTLAVTGVLASTGTASADGMNDHCPEGRACLVFAQGVYAGKVWVFEGCGYHPVNDKFKFAISHGNAFKIYYQGNLWDYVEPWHPRPLDGLTTATHVEIYC